MRRGPIVERAITLGLCLAKLVSEGPMTHAGSIGVGGSSGSHLISPQPSPLSSSTTRPSRLFPLPLACLSVQLHDSDFSSRASVGVSAAAKLGQSS